MKNKTKKMSVAEQSAEETTTKFRVSIILEVAEQSVEDMTFNAQNYIKEEIEDNHLYIEDIEMLTPLMNNNLETNLIILEMVKELKFNSEDNIDTLDIIPIALEIGEYNNIYNDGNWSDDERNDCYNKAYEIINNN